MAHSTAALPRSVWFKRSWNLMHTKSAIFFFSSNSAKSLSLPKCSEKCFQGFWTSGWWGYSLLLLEDLPTTLFLLHHPFRIKNQNVKKRKEQLGISAPWISCSPYHLGTAQHKVPLQQSCVFHLHEGLQPRAYRTSFSAFLVKPQRSESKHLISTTPFCALHLCASNLSTTRWSSHPTRIVRKWHKFEPPWTKCSKRFQRNLCKVQQKHKYNLSKWSNPNHFCLQKNNMLVVECHVAWRLRRWCRCSGSKHILRPSL